MAVTLQGKVILVTGGGSGIGRATALRLAREGAKIMIADYVPDSAVKTVAMIKEAGGTADCFAADVSVTRQVEAMINKTVETYGRLDGAFNNAGIEGKMGTDTVTASEENFDRTIAINLGYAGKGEFKNGHDKQRLLAPCRQISAACGQG
jgi:NAD(P)-dependent dehydrogenase (short-subunit alcohol dehydrogenase family)